MCRIRGGGWGNCLKYLKGEGTKRGEGKQRFLKRGKLGPGVGALKKGAGIPLRTMVASEMLGE